MIEIRLLTLSDLHLLANVADQVFDDPIHESSAREFLADSRHRIVVALDEDLVVGFISSVIYLHPDKAAPELWINEVGVASTHQGRGIGKQLMHKTLEVAKEAGCTEAWVLTEQSNAIARALYRSTGGREEDPNPVMYVFDL